jgi:hypothetical protein
VVWYVPSVKGNDYLIVIFIILFSAVGVMVGTDSRGDAEAGIATVE